MIPYAKPSVNNKDRKAVLDVLKTDFLTQGPKVEEFEKAISKQVKAKYCISTNSASSALHLACIGLGIKRNDIVYVSGVTFVASANCAKLLEAKIELIDINLSDYNISIKHLKEKLANAKSLNKLPQLLIITHMAGYPCNLKEIHQLSKKYKFKIIEDASHAFGTIYKNTSIGSCQYSHITVFSFHAIKNITTGEGGCLTLNSNTLNKRIKLLRSHGILRAYKKKKSFTSLLYSQKYIGFNYRLSDIQAALGLSQLKRLSDFKKRRNTLVKKYLINLKNNEDIILPNYDIRKIFFHLFIIRFKSFNIREKYILKLKKKNISVNFNYIPLNKFKHYSKTANSSKLKNLSFFYKTAITLPLFFDLTFKDQKKILKVINEK